MSLVVKELTGIRKLAIQLLWPVLEVLPAWFVHFVVGL
jgi:hypothetical protein